MNKLIWDININQIIFKNNLIRQTIILYPFIRTLSKFTRFIGFDIFICRYQSIITFYSAKEDEKLYPLNPKGDYINLGSGGFRHKKWINYDFPAKTKYYRQIQGKLNKDFNPINLNDRILNICSSQIEACYISHTLEHLPRKNSLRVIKQIYENLVNGGIIRIVLPDIDKLFDNLKINKTQFYEDDLFELSNKIFGKISKKDFKFEDLNQLFLSSSTTESYYKNLIKRWPYLELPIDNHPEYHLCCWNREFLLKNMESKNYFKNCSILEKNKSQFKPFCNSAVFDTTEPKDSIYLEIMKF